MRDVASILVIRRDNIGDLVCTTPLLAALRLRFPEAWIGVVANSYAAPILARNTDFNDLYVYRKLKHAGSIADRFSAILNKLHVIWALRARKIELAILASGSGDDQGAQLAMLVNPRRTIASEKGVPEAHEVERTFTAARQLGYEGPIPTLKVTPCEAEVQRIRTSIFQSGPSPSRIVVGIHISARRPAQRWPADRFAELATLLKAKYAVRIALFWAPGGEQNAEHPGDDEKARLIQDLAGAAAQIYPLPTRSLEELVAGLAACDVVVCSDGGAMHIAAALAKPTVCFFGDSPVTRWRPWGVPHIALSAQSGDVREISLEQALEATTVMLGVIRP